MKKIICMLLAVITVLSMAACGSQVEQPEPEKNTTTMPEKMENQGTSTQPSSKPEVTEENKMEKYLGEWVYMSNGGSSLKYTFTVFPDGTLTGSGYVFEEDVCYLWEEGNSDDSDTVVLCVSKRNDFGSFSIQLTLSEDNTYIAKMKTGLGTPVYFYRPCDYEAIELTKENMLDYLVLDQYFSYDVDSFGYTNRIYNNVDVRFKEGVGRPSYCVANFVFKMVDKEVIFAEKPEDYTVGITKDTKEGKPNVWGGSTPNVTGSLSYGFYFTEQWKGNVGGQTHTCDMTFYELIGAENVTGYVYIPVKN